MQSPPLIRIGTRKSRLAMAQAEIVRQKLLAAFPALAMELVPVMTSGDRITDKPLYDIGGKGLFIKELEEALLNQQIDMAVHSLKDMEAHLAPGLTIAAVLEREDPRDALITPHATSLKALPQGATVGTSSPRRAVQLKLFRHDLTIVPLRGNVTTRIEKIKNGEAQATLLAIAGLKRIGMEKEAAEILDIEHFLPAAGQGIIAIECATRNEALCNMLAAIRHDATHSASLAERQLLLTLNGSCRTPIAAYARFEAGQLKLNAMIAKPDGSLTLKASRSGDAKDGERMGKEAARELLAGGGGKCLI